MSYNLQDEINKAQIQSGAEIEKARKAFELMEQQLKIEVAKAEAQTLSLQEAIEKLSNEQDEVVFEVMKGSLLSKYQDKDENMSISTVKYVNKEEKALFDNIQTVGFIDMRVLDYMVPLAYEYGKSDVKQLLLGKEEVSDYYYSETHINDNVAGGAE